MTQQVSKPGTVTPDWTLIEADYRAGIKSLRTIAEEHGITHPSITKRAKRDGWTRDLAPKIQAHADAMVTRAAVTSQVSTPGKITERVVIEANATQQYQVRMGHREDVAAARQIWAELLGEFKAGSLKREDVEHLLSLQPEGITARQRDDARQTLVRLTSAGSRISNFNTLVHALERLVKLERQAYGIEAGDAGDDPSHPASAAAAHAQGHGRGLTDAERAIRLARLFRVQEASDAAVKEPSATVPDPGATVEQRSATETYSNGAPSATVPVPPDR